MGINYTLTNPLKIHKILLVNLSSYFLDTVGNHKLYDHYEVKLNTLLLAAKSNGVDIFSILNDAKDSPDSLEWLIDGFCVFDKSKGTIPDELLNEMSNWSGCTVLVLGKNAFAPLVNATHKNINFICCEDLCANSDGLLHDDDIFRRYLKGINEYNFSKVVTSLYTQSMPKLVSTLKGINSGTYHLYSKLEKYLENKLAIDLDIKGNVVDLKLSDRPLKKLSGMGIITLQQLCSIGFGPILACPGLGRKSFKEIELALTARGLSLNKKRSTRIKILNLKDFYDKVVFEASPVIPEFSENQSFNQGLMLKLLGAFPEIEVNELMEKSNLPKREFEATLKWITTIEGNSSIAKPSSTKEGFLVLTDFGKTLVITAFGDLYGFDVNSLY